ncbi:hypothetical protein DRO53_04005 [Candidatus Bathyarchaeota archaeon]|nr:MAG: hypothetical protein DRO53_04005 [Candidatus Bathyarchaeota archaeon]
MKDPNNPLADQLAQKFLEVFGNDKKRIRDRKVKIRQLFKFLGRTDVNDRWLYLGGDERPVRELPVLANLDFPEKLERSIKRLEEEMGFEAGTCIRLKIVSLLRTGGTRKGEDKELFGLRKGGGNGTWLIMESPDVWKAQIKAKENLRWYLNWIPKPIRLELWEIYQKRADGEKIFQLDVNRLRAVWKRITQEEIGVALNLHDMRKIGLTWMYVLGVPLEIATELNVGWRDLNTAKRHYLQLRGLLSKTAKAEYAKRIPEWFKEGLEEYTA